MSVYLKDNFSSQESRSLSHNCCSLRLWKYLFRRGHAWSSHKWRLNDLSLKWLTLCLLSCSSQHAHACNDFYLLWYISALLVLKEQKKLCAGGVYCARWENHWAVSQKMFYFIDDNKIRLSLHKKFSFKLPTIICVIHGSSQIGPENYFFPVIRSH